MSYLSFYSPLLRELGHSYAHLARSFPVWSSDMFFHGNLHDFWGKKVHHGFGAADIQETNSSIHIDADLPGIKKEDLHIHCNGDILSISGKRDQTIREADNVYSNMERVYGSITKQIRLPPNIDISKVTANYTDGVLHIDIPKPTGDQREEKDINIPISLFVSFEEPPIYLFVHDDINIAWALHEDDLIGYETFVFIFISSCPQFHVHQGTQACYYGL